jgi:hypothetical protein
MGGRSSWNGHAIVITVLTVVGLLIAAGAWFYPQPEKGFFRRTSGQSTSGPSSANSSSQPARSSRPQTGQIRYLSDMAPAGGGSFVANDGPADRHAMVIHCASGESNDRSREVSWKIPGPYSTLLGRVGISGKMDPEQRVQLEWFADGARIYNNSTLTLDTDTEFNGELAGAQDLRVRLTCTSSAGVATLLDAAVQR